MFLGQYRHTLDDKGRLTIPAKYREHLADGMVATRGPKRQIVLYPLSEWQALTARVDALPKFDERASNFRRLLYAYAEDLSLDRQGRINLPQRLLDYARISSDVVIVGLNTYIELWPPEAWSEIDTQFDEGSFAEDYFSTLQI
ncbi:MAG: division/cell wall cluster transcriptional repressor MraZ [Anaerolineae bacterium]